MRRRPDQQLFIHGSYLQNITNFVIHGVLLAHSWSVPKCGTSKDGNTYLTCLDTVMEHFSGIAALAHGLLGDFLLCSTLGLLCREKCEVDRG